MKEGEHMDQAILMVAHSNQTDFQLSETIEELENLALACEIETMDVMTQNLKHKTNATYIGSGKVEEIKMALEAQEANLVVFNVGLSPSQIRNLEEQLGVDVIDKNMLVLEIFSRRAETPESKAQVEIAQLKYVFPRMIGSYAHLGRQVSGFGNRNKGLGETQLELDRRNVDKRIRALNKSLIDYKRTRQITRASKTKSDLPLVSMLGYTNAGKSSLMNYLLKDEKERHVFVKDMLFASLETYSRRVHIAPNQSFILNDTVGFIQDLPADLVPAFHSTLEEIENSDLLLHVVDVSNPFYETHMKTIEETLETLNVSEIPMITIYNKIDRVEGMSAHTNDQSAFVSLKDKLGIEDLIELIISTLWQDHKTLCFKFPYSKMNLVDEILNNNVIITQENQEDGVYLVVNASENLIKRYKDFYLDR